MKNQFLRAVTTLYVLLPSFLFLYGWLKSPFAIITLVMLATFSVTIIIDVLRAFQNRLVEYKTIKKQIFSRDSISGIVLAFLLILVWLAFSGTGVSVSKTMIIELVMPCFMI